MADIRGPPDLVEKLTILQRAADVTDVQLATIQRITGLTWVNISEYAPDQLKSLAYVADAHEIQLQRANLAQQLASERIPLAETNANTEIRHGFGELHKGLSSLASVLDAKNYISNITKFAGQDKPGKTEKFDDWVRQVDRVKALKNLDDAAMRDICASTLTHAAADYCSRVIEEKKDITWVQLRTLLKERYASVATEFTARYALRQIKQKPDESVQGIAERIMKLAEAAYSPEDRKSPLFKSEIIDILIGAVHDHGAMKKMINNRPTSFDKGVELALSAQHAETIYQMFRQNAHSRGNTAYQARVEQPMEVSAIKRLAQNDGRMSNEQATLINGLVHSQKQTNAAIRELASQLQTLSVEDLAEDYPSSSEEESEPEELDYVAALGGSSAERRMGKKDRTFKRGDGLEHKPTKFQNGKQKGRTTSPPPYGNKNGSKGGYASRNRVRWASRSPSRSESEYERPASPRYERREDKSPYRSKRGSSPYRSRVQDSDREMSERQRQDDYSLDRCYHCHKEGHQKKDCKKLRVTSGRRHLN